MFWEEQWKQISSLFLQECWGLALGKGNQPSVNVTGNGTKWLGEGDADSEKIHLFLLCKAAASLVSTACWSVLPVLSPLLLFVTWWDTGISAFAWDEGGRRLKSPKNGN